MNLTLGDMIASIRNHGFSDSDEATLTALLNDAYEDIWTREGWPFKEAEADVSVTAGDDTPTMPTDFGKVIALGDNTNSIELEFWRADELQLETIGALTDTGQPLVYYFVGNTLKLYPVPDSAYTLKLKYVKTFTPLEADTDVPALPNNHRVIVLGALVSAYDMNDDTDLATRFEGRFENRLLRAREDWWVKQYDSPEFVRDIYANENTWEAFIE
jgi:hypothetical protein